MVKLHTYLIEQVENYLHNFKSQNKKYPHICMYECVNIYNYSITIKIQCYSFQLPEVLFPEIIGLQMWF